MARVFVDTNVLFPFSLMDLMLTLSEDRVHTMVWSDRLLEEWEHVIVREQRRTAQSAALITATIREFFQEDRVPATAYKDLLAEIDGPDPDDIHHMAAAIAGDVGTLITWDLGDFRPESLAPKASPSPRPTRTCAPCSTSSPPKSSWPSDVSPTANSGLR